MKGLLLESPDTLIIRDPSDPTGKKRRYVSYLSQGATACTAIIYDDPLENTADNFMGMVKNGETFPIVELWDPVKNDTARASLEWFSGMYEDGQVGHRNLEEAIDRALIKIYGRENSVDHFDGEGIRVRIFNVDSLYYFTFWTATRDRYAKYFPVFLKIVKAAGMDPTKMLWECNTGDLEMEYEDRLKNMTWEEIQSFAKPEKPQDTGAATSVGEVPAVTGAPPEEIKAVESELKKKIKELQAKQSELEADSHVKGATWSESDRNRYKLTMLNLDAEIKALVAADKAGETDVSKVIIKTIDSLEGQNGDVVPADILYAELERKLSKYGTSAVAIIRNLRDRGIDIKKALREIQSKHGNNMSSTQLMESLGGYLKESESSVEVFSGNVIDKVSHMNSVDDFLKLFIGHKLETLMDKLSLSRLYVMNKFDGMLGDDPQQKMVMLLDCSLAFINFRQLDPLRKHVDTVDAEERKNPKYQKHHAEKMALLRSKFAAQRAGDESLARKLSAKYMDMEDFPTSYQKNMKDMDAKRELIWSTPLSEAEVLPQPTDSTNDKKRYQEAQRAFEKLKRGTE
jgi:hypothetical protein